MQAAPRRLNLYSIPPGEPFLYRLAEDVIAGAYFGGMRPDKPFGLADITIFLPTRRACRALREVFFDVTGETATLLPAITPIGDPDDEDAFLDALEDGEDFGKTAIGGLERQLFLSQLIMHWGEAQKAASGTEASGLRIIPASPANAAALARDLMTLLDDVTTEENADFSKLAALVPERYSEYFSLSIDFLRIVTEWWPHRLKERQALDGIDLRNRRIIGRARRIEAGGYPGPVIAAGSTGSIPATAKLIAQIAQHEKGAVVLPGLDTHLSADEWNKIIEDEAVTHPQFGLAQLLRHVRATRDDVSIRGVPSPRAALISEALRPADATVAWTSLRSRLDPDGALEGISVIEAANEREEALAISLVMRAVLEEQNTTAVLVTPDRTLARRVSAEMKRWGVTVDDSAGTPLTDTPAGVFARLAIEAIAQELAPFAFLALTKHPLMRVGQPPSGVRSAVRRFEKEVLRGPRPAPGTEGLRRVLRRAAKGDGPLVPLIDRITETLKPLEALADGRKHPLPMLIAALWDALLGLSCDDDGTPLIEAGDDGRALAAFFADLIEAKTPPIDIALAEFPGLLVALMAGCRVRPSAAGHPQLHIWGPLEARLQAADLILLGGLNEGTWPALPQTDPWLSRPMRQDMGLTPLERRIGLAAHDFAMGLAAKKVIITRATKAGGAPTVPSRWLQRLRAVAHAVGRDVPEAEVAEMPVLDMARRLDEVPYKGRPAPAPKPPLRLRPRKLSVTRIEDWVRDPYTVYARTILKLRPLDPIDQPPDVALRGTVIHNALARFVAETPLTGPLDENAAFERLTGIGDDLFAGIDDRPEIRAVWWPRFLRVGEWFIDEFRTSREAIAHVLVEADGELNIATPGGAFKLTARADRIDTLKDGTLRIIDYKTGTPPTAKQVFSGLSPQLTLEAAIAQGNGFTEEPRQVSAITYLRLTGGDPAGEWHPRDSLDRKPVDLGTEIDKALTGLKRRVALFDDEAMPYAPMRIPKFRLAYGEYDHLARVREWGLAGENAETGL